MQRGPTDLLKVFALAALLSIVVTGLTEAQGQLLSMKRATRVAMEVAQADCEKNPHCDGAGVRACKRLTLRKVRCASRIEGVDAKGPFACERPVIVKRNRRTGKIKHTTRDQRCAHFQS